MSSDQPNPPSLMTDVQLEHALDNFITHEPRPLNELQESIQPIEITILEYIHNNKYNHKLYSLIQNTRHDVSLETEQLKICLKLKSSSACLHNSSHHPTNFKINSSMDFSLITTLLRYDYIYFN